MFDLILWMNLLQDRIEAECMTCRLTLPDGSVTAMVLESGSTIGETLIQFADRILPGLDFMDVVFTETNQVSICRA